MTKWSELPPEKRVLYRANMKRKREAEKAADPVGFRQRTSAKNRANRASRVARDGDAAEKSRQQRKWLKHKYGLTPEQVDEMIAKAGNRCECCGRHADEMRTRHAGGRTLHVDHCHDTGRVRGILCFKCNMMVGFANNDPEIFRKAIAYLEAH